MLAADTVAPVYGLTGDGGFTRFSTQLQYSLSEGKLTYKSQGLFYHVMEINNKYVVSTYIKRSTNSIAQIS